MFTMLPCLATAIADIWFALPLIVAISLVYAATRHEEMPTILLRAARVFGWITAFMAVAFALLMFISSRL